MTQAKDLAGPLVRLLPKVARDLHASEHLGQHHPSTSVDDCPHCWLRAGRALASIQDHDPHHVIQLSDNGWTLKHPLACRETELFSCPVNAQVSDQMSDGAPEERGTYVVALDTRGFAVLAERLR